jgi:hypothetical protein
LLSAIAPIGTKEFVAGVIYPKFDYKAPDFQPKLRESPDRWASQKSGRKTNGFNTKSSDGQNRMSQLDFDVDNDESCNDSSSNSPPGDETMMCKEDMERAHEEKGEKNEYHNN